MEKSRLKDFNFVFVVGTFRALGGAERQALILANYIKTNISNNVIFIAFEDGTAFKQMLNDQGYKTYYYPFEHHVSKPKKVLQYYWLIKKIKAHRPDVLIPYVSESNKIVAQIWKYTGAQFAFWNQRDEGRKLYGTPNEKKLIRQVSSIVSNSFEGRDALMRVYGLKSDEVKVINNGIVPYNKPNEKKDWHSALELPKSRPIISMIANIKERKDHETLIKAWSLVIAHCKSNRSELPFLALSGRKEGTYDSLRLLAFDLKLSNDIAFTGELNPVQSLISESLFCVFSSNLEGCPNGVLECMEQGKAVVGTDISGIHQALGETYAQYTFAEANDPKKFSEKIIHLLEHPKLIEEIGDYNSKRIGTEFSVEKMACSYLDLIDEGLIPTNN